MNTNKIYAEAIANEYSLKSESKVLALKKLDRRAKLPANISAYSMGIISALIFGAGMSFSTGVIGAAATYDLILGIVIGLVGMIGMGLNYFIYKKLLETGKQKYAADIIRLASEISGKI